MPLYEYRNCITGKIEVQIRPVDQRNNPLNEDGSPANHLNRIEVPSRISTPIGVPNPGDVDQSVPRALYQQECTLPSQHFDKVQKEHGFSKADYKKYWSKEWTSQVE